MRRWIALLAAVAALAVTGTALAMTGASEEPAQEERVTTTTVGVERTTTTIEEKAEPERSVEVVEVETDVVVWEKPDTYVPYEPADHNPPAVEILYPEDGQVFETHEVVFEGITEPGARVFFGEKQADVRDDGSWRIVLDLDEGENLVTATAIDEAGNDATDSVTVVVDIPEKPKAEEPKKEEPKTEEPKQEEPKTEEPKQEEPKAEEPSQDEVEWEFAAHQTYGECSENPPYDVFYGTAHPGYTIVVESPFGRQTTEVGENGEWEIKVYFEGAPVGDVFEVWVGDQHDHHQVFEFVHTA